MFRILAVMLVLAQANSTRSLPAVDVKAADIQATVKQEIATKTTDIPIRTVDAGGHHIGVAVVHREKGAGPNNAAIHDKVSEVYQITEGSGHIDNPDGQIIKFTASDEPCLTKLQLVVTQHEVVCSAEALITVTDSLLPKRPSATEHQGLPGIKGGVSRRVAKGDMVIIPAGTSHGFSEIQESITYTVVRIDPARVIKLK